MLIVGILLVCLTLTVAFAIGVKANQSVRQYNEHEHEMFVDTVTNGTTWKGKGEDVVG